MQPTIVVVNAELYCVQSTVEYIRTNLQNKTTSHYSWQGQISQCRCNMVDKGWLWPSVSISALDKTAMPQKFAINQMFNSGLKPCLLVRTPISHKGLYSYPMMQERMNWLRKNKSDQPSYSTAWEENRSITNNRTPQGKHTDKTVIYIYI